MQQVVIHKNLLKNDLEILRSHLPTILINLKTKIDRLNVDILIPVPVDLSKLSDVVQNDVVKKMYIMLRSKILKMK